MKIHQIVLILTLIRSATSANELLSIADDHLLSKALLDVTHELFTRHEIQFEIVIYGKSSPHINDVIDGLGRGSTFSQIRKFDQVKQVNDKRDLHPDYILWKPAIILFNSTQEIKQFLEMHEMDRWNPKQYKFIIYAEKLFNVAEICVKKLDFGPGEIIWFSYFIVQHKSKF